ncbi:hypothetical protein [Turkeypox virus]|uniref:FEN1-like nuclease n=1 Tax=Turkeypox virus TaxID=336486 RepID=A0A0M3PBA2_9POXV|nr:hypothetical protein ASN15_gp086 [Turkeypox virus]ALA62460.1 hypothetical protein [Turkeypox virus]
MGIKNLKAVLLLKHRLRILDAAQKSKELYVDFLGLFMAVAYSVTSTETLRSILNDKFKFMKSISEKVVLFVDRGSIVLKSSLREKRKQLLYNQYQRKKNEIAHLEHLMNSLSTKDELYEEQRESITSKIEKNNYYMFLYDKKNVESIMDEVLSSLKDIDIHYCDHIDAEFMMCYKAREYYNTNGIWPAILSSDQDTICLLCIDTENKILYDSKMSYMLSPNKYTAYLAKLMILVNGCDFFSGLTGASINKDNYSKYAMFTEFNRDNVLCSLAYKNYSLVKIDNINEVSEHINKIFDFIELYTSLDETAYNIDILPCINIKEFLSVLVYNKWNDITKKYAFTSNILRNIYNVYTSSNKYVENTSDNNNDILCLIQHYEYRKITKKVVTSFISRLNIDIKDHICLLGISPSVNLYIGFEKKFYFNNLSIIENPSKMLNIDI